MNTSGLVAVVIGRNEGERLVQCLRSLDPARQPVIYVDSGSTDGSPERASALGATVLALDMTQPFTAARARNAGWRMALVQWPQTRFIQFVDGDCEVQPAWLDSALAYLIQHPDVVAVAGRRRERFPERSRYNLLCDLEWAVQPGPARAFGGDVLLRCQALLDSGGYDEHLIAGEEPELCVRLRARGGRIVVLATEMTLHDAAMQRFSQWWQRSKRAGYAYAEGVAMHGAAPERHGVRELRRCLGWGLLLPLACAFAWPLLGVVAALPLLLYPLQFARLYLRGAGNARTRRLWSTFNLLGKFAEVQGALRFWRLRLLRQRGGLIEYK